MKYPVSLDVTGLCVILVILFLMLQLLQEHNSFISAEVLLALVRMLFIVLFVPNVVIYT